MSGLVFRRYGGSLQVHIEDFKDLLAAVELREALWVATACPTTGLAVDLKFMQCMDSDNNHRVRTEELRTAVRWTGEQFDKYDGCDKGIDRITLAHLSPKAAPLRATAELILRYLDAEKKDSIDLEQVRTSAAALRAAGVNGDGIVAPETVKDEGVAELVRNVLATLPPKKNRADKDGVDEANLEAFRTARAAGIARLDRKASVFVWGDDSPARAAKVEAVRPRVEEYFLQCRLVAAQPEAAARLRLADDRVGNTLGDVAALTLATSALPLAPPNAAGELRWAELVRGPLFEALHTFRKDVADPELGSPAALTEASFAPLANKAKAILEWEREVETDKVKALGEKLREFTDAQLDAVVSLSKADLAEKDKLDAIETLEKLVLYQRWLLRFANNFISMPDLYDPRKDALFERGNLTLSGRLFTFSVLVPDRESHAALSATNTMFIAYVKIEGGDPAVNFEVAVPVTAGNAQGVTVGKRGVFTDLDGKQYDATVTHLVRNPVSLWEAAIAPFSKISELIGSRITKLTESGDKAMEGMLARTDAATTAAAERGGSAAATEAPVAPVVHANNQAAQQSSAALAGSVAAVGIALAAVGSTVGFLASTARELGPLGIAKVAVAITALIMFPAALGGWLKLRKRNLAVALEGSGWALNDKLLLGKMGRLFTRRPPRPKDSTVDHSDLVGSALDAYPSDEEEQVVRPGFVLALIVALAALAFMYRAPLTVFLGGHPAPHESPSARGVHPPAAH